MKRKERLFDIPFIGRRYFYKRIIENEGGEQESQTLRDYYANKYKVFVDRYSYGGMFSPGFNIGGREVTIGRYCSFASDIYYYGANHPMQNATMSPYFYNKSFGFNVRDVDRFSLSVGHDVWIGYGVIITCGCQSIGNGAVIGAGSVVTKDVPSYTIVAGTPARELRKRFNEPTINELESSKWWELSPEELYRFYSHIEDPDEWAKHIHSYRGI